MAGVGGGEARGGGRDCHVYYRRVEFPRSVGGGLWWPRVTRGYIVSMLAVVSRGLLGGADTPGKGGWGVGSSFPY